VLKSFCRLAALCVITFGFFSANASAAENPAPKKDPKDMTIDELQAAELCPVTRLPAKPIYHVTVGDKKYTFATKEARREFEANPEKFGAKVVKKEPKPEAKPTESKPAPAETKKNDAKTGEEDMNEMKM
jgi:hypothetical protein